MEIEEVKNIIQEEMKNFKAQVEIKQISISERKFSLAMTYRMDKSGNKKVNGFDVKVRGDDANGIEKELTDIIKVGLFRMDNPELQ